MSGETVGFAIIVVSALLLLTLERRFPYDPGQKLFRPGFWTDLLGYGLVQSYLLGVLIGQLIELLDRASGLSRFRLVSDWPLPIQCVAFLIAHDLYIYCFHRWQHRNRFLWRIHEAHHSGHDVDWLSGTRSHALEILVNQTIEFAPIVLLGAAPEVAVFKGVVDAVWGMYIHSNLDVRSRRLQYVLNGPQMHRWHHARDYHDDNANFATKLALWDWLFGTAYLPAHKPAGYGLAGDVTFPAGFVAQQLYAFRPFDAALEPNTAAPERDALG